MTCCVLVSGAAFGQQADATKSAARDLMKRRLYGDAVKVLLREVGRIPEADAGLFQIMLGESYYMQKQYAEARPWYIKAQRFLATDDEANQTIAEYRLACIAYRMNDPAAGFKQTDDFMRHYPTDRRSGSLLLFKMQALAKRGAAATEEIEAIRESIAEDARRYGPATDIAADNVLTEFYLALGGNEKARDRYRNIVLNFQQVTRQFIEEHRPIPPALERGHDKAAVQLASMSLKDKDYEDAVRWLSIVRYDDEMKRRARLLLAQVAYEQNDFRRAERHLKDDDFIETVPAGPLRSDMYLLLGFCSKRALRPVLEDVAAYFSKVEPGTKSYFQAQMGLADTYERWRRIDDAITALENAKVSAKYEPQALASLGRLYMETGDGEKRPEKQEEFFKLAVERFESLTTKYPNSREAKDSNPLIQKLIEKGYEVRLAETDADMVGKWAETVAQSPGSGPAARALVSIARQHHKVVIDDSTGAILKLPDYAACAAAATKLLDASVYTGTDLAAETWVAMRAEALYYRGYSHMASATQSVPPGKTDVPPTYLVPASMDQAIQDLEAARDIADPKQVDLVKNIELGLLEAMFKSGKEELREEASARFNELGATYGAEPRFQKMAYELAKWFQDRKMFPDAAREYRGIADRSQNLAPDDLMQLLYLSGQLYSKSAHDAATATGDQPRRYGIYIYPKRIFNVAAFLDTYRPFEKLVSLEGVADTELSAEDAIRLISKASRIPFTWSSAGGGESVTSYLKQTRVTLAPSSGTVMALLKQILNDEHHELALDIGLADSSPTVVPTREELEDPEMVDVVVPVEILDTRHAALRHPTMTRQYGAWQSAPSGETMLFHVFNRVEEITKLDILWAPGVEKDDVLATELTAAPGVPAGQAVSAAVMLGAVMQPLDLKYRIVERDLSSQLYDKAKDSFSEIRRISPKSDYGEKSLYTLALNYFQQKEYERMRIVLTEYLKIFDNPSFRHYHDANFWVGWIFEHDRRYREATRYYNRAAAEKLLVVRPRGEELTREELKEKLSYETVYSLEEVYTGDITGMTVAEGLIDFVQLYAGVAMGIEPSLLTTNIAVADAAYQEAQVFDVLLDALDAVQLGLRAENANPDVAQKAYFRLARSYQKDGRPQEGLSGCRVLLDRYPQTERRRDVYKLQLEIYKALKDYRNVLATLDLLKKELEAEGHGYKIDFEIAWVYFDLCRYADAVTHYEKALGGAQTGREDRNIRDGYARALYMNGDLKASLREYHTLVATEPQALRAFVDEMMIWYLERALGEKTSADLPPAAAKLLTAYEKLDNSQRSRVNQTALAKITWGYYITALLDLKNGDSSIAIDKLDAAGNSPDDWLAANAMYRLARVHMAEKQYVRAIEALEYLLFSTRSAEAEVKAGYALGLCYTESSQTEKARHRFEQLVQRFPDSPYADKAKEALASLTSSLPGEN
ncbi:MAG: tetratricopeptide repeat protein [Verrucomicrobia bacterium]|nr:tetratricopeptide repeat protein [Verrucomicrobiota bacterium]